MHGKSAVTCKKLEISCVSQLFNPQHH